MTKQRRGERDTLSRPYNDKATTVAHQCVGALELFEHYCKQRSTDASEPPSIEAQCTFCPFSHSHLLFLVSNEANLLCLTNYLRIPQWSTLFSSRKQTQKAEMLQ